MSSLNTSGQRLVETHKSEAGEGPGFPHYTQARTQAPRRREETHREKYLGKMIHVGVAHVGPYDAVSALALEALLDVALGEPPERLARRHPEQQVVLVVARDRLAVFRLLRLVPASNEEGNVFFY